MSSVNTYLPKVGDILEINNEYILVVTLGRKTTNRHGSTYQRSVWSEFKKGVTPKIIGKEEAVIWDFYWVPCTKSGSLKNISSKVKRYGAANVNNHSNMLNRKDQDEAKKVGFVKIKTIQVFHNCKKYEWTETGILELDQYLSQVDDRYDLWCDVLKPNREYWKIELYQFAWNFHYTKAHRAKIFAETQNYRCLRDLPLPKCEVA